MNNLKLITILITFILISTNIVANALGGIDVRYKYANKNVTDFVYNDEDKNNPYVMIYFDDGSQIKEKVVISEYGRFGFHFVDIKELSKQNPPKPIILNGKKLVPIRVKYANQNVTDFVYNNEDKNNPYVIVYFDDGTQIKENNIKLNNGTCYVYEKKLTKEKISESITVNGEKFIPIRVKYANQNVTDFVYNNEDKNHPYIMIYFDDGHHELEKNIIIKNSICYTKSK